MNKAKTMLAAVGGVMALLVLGAAAWAYLAMAAKTAAIEGDEEEGTDGLETVQAKIDGLVRQEITPCAASVKALAANREALEGWTAEARKAAARGDRPILKTTPAAFKEFIVSEAKRLAALPAQSGVLTAPTFEFGPFKEYILLGKMPAEADLPKLQRTWDDVTLLFETLSACGVVEVTGLAFKGGAEAQPKDEGASRKTKKKSRKAAKDDAAAAGPTAEGYVITFKTRPAAFVKAMNALETCERFTVVENFSFARAQDAVQTALGGGEAKKAESTGGRRGRRRAAVVQQVKEEEPATKNAIVTDPLLDAPLTVTLTVSTYDFGSLLETKDEKKEESK